MAPELVRQTFHARDEHRGARGGTLPPDVLADASRRLGWVALLYAVTYALAYFGPHVAELFLPCATCQPFRSEPVVFTVATTSILIGFGVFAVSRAGWLSSERLLDLGLAFEVVGALGIAVAEFWGTQVAHDPRMFLGLSWTCVWIVVFPVLAPSTPRKTIVAALLAASMVPLVLSTALAVGSADWGGLSTGALGVYSVFTTYLSVGVAYIVAKVIYRFGDQLRAARAVGSYELLEPLGKGGMGEVWRAQHQLLAKPAAVKLIRPELLRKLEGHNGGQNGVRRRFEREAQATATLRSVHTVELYDYGVSENGAFFYVMEMLEGLNLEQLVQDHGPQAPGRTIHFLRQVCRSLAEAHEAGMVHRDIKPANIYVCRFGSEVDFVKVLDFGLVKAHHVDDANAAGLRDPNLTGGGWLPGTPAYAPPEMMRGGPLDGRADLYSLGCVAYWLLTGTPVFRSTTAAGLIVDHARETPEPPSLRHSEPIPDDLETVVMRCLEKDPDRRFASAMALDRALALCAIGPTWIRSDAVAWWDEREHAQKPAELAHVKATPA